MRFFNVQDAKTESTKQGQIRSLVDLSLNHHALLEPPKVSNTVKIIMSIVFDTFGSKIVHARANLAQPQKWMVHRKASL